MNFINIIGKFPRYIPQSHYHAFQFGHYQIINYIHMTFTSCFKRRNVNHSFILGAFQATFISCNVIFEWNEKFSILKNEFRFNEIEDFLIYFYSMGFLTAKYKLNKVFSAIR